MSVLETSTLIETTAGAAVSTSLEPNLPVAKNEPEDVASVWMLGVCLAGLVAGVLLYLSPAVTPDRFDIWSLLGIGILLLGAPVSGFCVVATAFFVVRAVRQRKRRSRLVAVLWLMTAALTALAFALMYPP